MKIGLRRPRASNARTSSRSRRRPGRLRWVVIAVALLSGMAGCGVPPGASYSATITVPVGGEPTRHLTPLGAFGSGDTSPAAAGASSSSMPNLRASGSARAGRPAEPAVTLGAASADTKSVANSTVIAKVSDPATVSVESSYGQFLYALSGFLDSLNQSWIPKIQAAATDRLAQASVRTGAAILYSREHGVGELRDSHVSVKFQGSDEALLTDCEDEQHFYLVSDSTGDADPAVHRGYFTGTAVLVLQNGKWLVDIYRPSTATCTY